MDPESITTIKQVDTYLIEKYELSELFTNIDRGTIYKEMRSAWTTIDKLVKRVISSRSANELIGLTIIIQTCYGILQQEQEMDGLSEMGVTVTGLIRKHKKRRSILD